MSSYIDRNGYQRRTCDNRLVHRNFAYENIYRQNREKFPLPFRKYQVHHIDGNKINNDISNLAVVTREEHKNIHGILEDRIYSPPPYEPKKKEESPYKNNLTNYLLY